MPQVTICSHTSSEWKCGECLYCLVWSLQSRLTQEQEQSKRNKDLADAWEYTAKSVIKERDVLKNNRLCPTCKSKGFDLSILSSDRCTFCDGTEGGAPPEVDEE